MRILLISAGLLALAGCHKASETQNQGSEAAAPGLIVKAADRTDKGKPAPDIIFNDPDGNPTSLKAFAGKPTLVNLWASWCAPCVKELPTLDRLARARQGKLNVVAISQDTGPHASVEAFLQEHKIGTLDAYQDPKMDLSPALGAEVLPTSVLFDSNGREVWRFVGDQDWTSPEAAKLLAEAGVSVRQ
jgi:thiol-disulfide isomerase/thioredoxin